MNFDELEQKIINYHKVRDKGEVPVYTNVVAIAEVIAPLVGEDQDAVALILHDGDKLEQIFHLTAEAAAGLYTALEQIFDDVDEDDDDDSDDDLFGDDEDEFN